LFLIINKSAVKEFVSEDISTRSFLQLAELLVNLIKKKFENIQKSYYREWDFRYTLYL